MEELGFVIGACWNVVGGLVDVEIDGPVLLVYESLGAWYSGAIYSGAASVLKVNGS